MIPAVEIFVFGWLVFWLDLYRQFLIQEMRNYPSAR